MCKSSVYQNQSSKVNSSSPLSIQSFKLIYSFDLLIFREKYSLANPVWSYKSHNTMFAF